MDIGLSIKVGSLHAGSGGGASPPLSGVSGIDSAYSVRKLVGGYSGACMRVRRDSDDVEQDIIFDGTGSLDTTTLVSFIGSSKGYVTKWYDQSGNSNDLTETDHLKQPTIVDTGGVLYEVNGKPAIHQDHLGTKDRMYASGGSFSSTSTIYSVCSITENKTILLSGAITGSTPFVGCGENGNGQNSYNNSGSVSNRINGSDIGSNRNDMHDASISQQNIIIFEGVNMTSWNAYSTDYVNTSYKGANKLQELVIFNVDKSSSTSAIEAEMNSYYSVY